ncbi:MAG: GNAT family N-acetyltransferase [Luteibaculaceae bacterium]
MQPIIDSVPVTLLKRELNKNTFLRYTNKGNNEVYLVNHLNSPNVLQEIGRLREVTFRAAGGGTGKELDLDANDLGENAYEQLIVWNPEQEEIVSGYRLMFCSKATVFENGDYNLSMASLFHFSEEFKRNFLPNTIELGRSFVQPKYQPAVDNRNGLFSLDNLWDGLGAVIAINPQIEYLFGKVTMYTHYNKEARDILLCFIKVFFNDNDNLVWPISPLHFENSVDRYNSLFEGLDYKDAYRVLNTRVRDLGENIPPLINTYMNLSPTMRSFGTAVNPKFGGVEETGILISIKDIYPTKKSRHIETYERDSIWGEPS